MEKTHVELHQMSERRDYGFVPGTPAERVSLVWPLTLEALSLSERYNAERPLQRHVVTVIRQEG